MPEINEAMDNSREIIIDKSTDATERKLRDSVGSLEKNSEKIKYSEILWDEIGIHRPLSSFWYQYVIWIMVAVPAIMVYSWLIPNYILPFPSALGFQSLTVGWFSLFFSIMDFATGPAAVRYIAQYAEINPPKALRYAQFFIYFQMFTGLIQVTAVTLYCFLVVVHTDLNFAMWFFLMYSLTQYPGMLSVFNSLLSCYQRYDKLNLVGILQGVLFENVTQVVFIMVGRWWGSHNLAVGELMGATIGYIIGKYVDDFIAMGLSAYFVKQVLEPYGLKVIDVLIPRFTWEEVKQSLLYGIKLMWASIIATFADYLTLILMVAWIPNYISILAYVEIARNVANLVSVGYDFGPLLSEAYNNGKKVLTQYTISRYIQHWWYLSLAFTMEVITVVPVALEILGGSWGRAAWIIPIYVLPRLMVMPPVIGANILVSCNRPIYRTYGMIVEKVTKIITVILWLAPFGLIGLIGYNYSILLYAWHDIPAYIAITIAEFYFIHKKVAPLKLNIKATFIGGTLASLPLIPINLFMMGFLKGMESTGAEMLTLTVVIFTDLYVILLGYPAVIFFFLGFFGGIDKIGLEEFGKAVHLSGPSKPVLGIYHKLMKFGYKLSPLKERFPTPHEGAYREIAELMAIKYPKRVKSD